MLDIRMPDQDGLVFLAVARRTQARKSQQVTIRRIQCKRRQSRAARQDWVVEQLLTFIADELESIEDA